MYLTILLDQQINASISPLPCHFRYKQDESVRLVIVLRFGILLSMLFFQVKSFEVGDSHNELEHILYH